MMEIPILGGDLDFSEWFRGLLAAFISGGSSAVTSGFVVSSMDPADYNLRNGRIYSLMGAVFVVNGLVGMAMFLRTKPVPDHKVVTTTTKETVVQPTSPPKKVETTVVETHQEPLEPKP